MANMRVVSFEEITLVGDLTERIWIILAKVYTYAFNGHRSQEDRFYRCPAMRVTGDPIRIRVACLFEERIATLAISD